MIAQFSSQYLPAKVRAQLPGSVQQLLEKDVDADGVLTVIHSDDFKTESGNRPHVSDYDYYLTSNSAKPLHLHFDGEAPHLRTGARVHTHGTLIENELVVANAGDSNFASLPIAAAIAGANQQTIVMMVNFTNNAVQPFNHDQIYATMFTGPQSVSAYYLENSYGKAVLAGDVVGWYTINYAMPTSGGECQNYFQDGNCGRFRRRRIGSKPCTVRTQGLRVSRKIRVLGLQDKAQLEEIRAGMDLWL